MKVIVTTQLPSNMSYIIEYLISMSYFTSLFNQTMQNAFESFNLLSLNLYSNVATNDSNINSISSTILTVVSTQTQSEMTIGVLTSQFTTNNSVSKLTCYICYVLVFLACILCVLAFVCNLSICNTNRRYSIADNKFSSPFSNAVSGFNAANNNHNSQEQGSKSIPSETQSNILSNKNHNGDENLRQREQQNVSVLNRVGMEKVFAFCLYLIDFYSDLLFNVQLIACYYYLLSNHSNDDLDNNLNDFGDSSLLKIDNYPFIELFILSIFGAVFIIVPFVVAFGKLFKFEMYWQKDVSIGERMRAWIQDWGSYLLIVTIISGSPFGSVNLANVCIFLIGSLQKNDFFVFVLFVWYMCFFFKVVLKLFLSVL